MSSPIKNGVITDWDAMEDIWYHMFYEELLLPPDKYPILLTEPVGNPMSCKEKLIEVNDFILHNSVIYSYLKMKYIRSIQSSQMSNVCYLTKLCID